MARRTASPPITGTSATAGDDSLRALGRNGRRSPPRPRIELRDSAAATPEEAAAIAAAIEQFLRDTAPAPAQEGDRESRWLRAALEEGVDAGPEAPGRVSARVHEGRLPEAR